MKLITFFFIFFLCFRYDVFAKKIKSEDDISKQMIKNMRKSQTDDEKVEFRKIIQRLTFPNYIYRASMSSYRNPRLSITCLACRSVVSSIVNLHRQGVSMEDISEFVITMCIAMKIQTPAVCRGVVETNAPVFDYILRNQPLFSSRSFCGVLIQGENRNTCPYSDERYEWSIDIPEKSKTVVKNALSKHEDDKSFKIAHITDTHYDPAYEANGLAECDEPTCCRKGQEQKDSRHSKVLADEESDLETVYTDEENGSMYIDLDNYEEKSDKKHKREVRERDNDNDKRAGYWGDYRDCDIPWWSFVDGIEKAAEHKDIKYVYYTGDAIDHGVWETSKEMITTSLNDTMNQFKKSFGDIPVIPAIGNHESQPLDQFAPSYVTDPDVSTEWLYKLLIQLWDYWLPSDTNDSIMTGGYYTILVKPGLRAIVLNSNLCYVYNWWIHLDPKDPSDQLKWLVHVLYEAEKSGERVHIISHIPAGESDVYYTCNREYFRIIKRFARIIIAEFNGHTHNDEFKIYYKDEVLGTNPMFVAWNGGSLTPYSFVNPNYRIIEFDSDTFELVDFETWSYNLTEANLTPEKRPRWFKLYSFKNQYGTSSLNATDINKLIHRMVTTDKKLLSVDYHAFRGKYAPNFVDVACDDKCIRTNLCYMVKTDIYENDKCNSLWKSYNQTDTKQL